uniref:Syntaxin 5 n=3 Tax=root TaxID=1 RepID=A0A674GR59_TAEGU
MQARRRLGPRQREPGAPPGPPRSAAAPPPPPEPPPADVMSCRDRTQEFLFACQSLQGRQDRGLPAGRAGPGPGRPRSEFSLMAKRIGKDLSNTFAKLEKLTLLAKRKSLFDDKSVEIEELTYIIKQDMGSLNTQIAALQELLRARRGPGGRHLQSHSSGVLLSLQSKLASMSNDFKSVLEVRTEVSGGCCCFLFFFLCLVPLFSFPSFFFSLLFVFFFFFFLFIIFSFFSSFLIFLFPLFSYSSSFPSFFFFLFFFSLFFSFFSFIFFFFFLFPLFYFFLLALPLPLFTFLPFWFLLISRFFSCSCHNFLSLSRFFVLLLFPFPSLFLFLFFCCFLTSISPLSPILFFSLFHISPSSPHFPSLFPHFLSIFSPFSFPFFPVFSLFSPFPLPFLPIFSPFSPHFLSVFSPFPPPPIFSLFFPHFSLVLPQNLKQQRSRREHFSRAPVSALAANNLGSPAVLQPEPQRPGAVAIEMDGRTSQQLQLLDEQDSYIQSRADTMHNIESTIVELGSIFQQLAHMVKEQEETIQRIDSSVEDAQLNVEAAHGEILKYFQSVSANRWLLLKIFLLLLLFFIVFVVFLA